MSRRARVAGLGAAVAVLAAGPSVAPALATSGADVAFRFTDPRIVESSGLAASVIHPNVVWTHNDSGGSTDVFAVDVATGNTVATVTLRGVLGIDWEAIAIGRDELGRAAVFVGDVGSSVPIGGNAVVYRFVEPTSLHDQTVDVTAYEIEVAGEPRPNVEALLVDPRDNRVHIVSKDETRGTAYIGPDRLVAGTVNVFTPEGPTPAQVSDGTFLADGRVVLRGNSRARIFDRPGGRELARFTMPPMSVGESVTATPDGRALLVGSEGAGSAVWRLLLPANLVSTPSTSPTPIPPPVPTTSALATPTPAPTPTPAATPTPIDLTAADASPETERTVGFGILAAATAVFLALVISRLVGTGR